MTCEDFRMSGSDWMRRSGRWLCQSTAAASFTLAGIGGVISDRVAQGQELPSVRSVHDARGRLVDEHDRPYFRQTQSHRGFEIREPQFTVVAMTRLEDARWAAEQVSWAWQRAAALADRWTSVHHHPDFGLSALQVVITDQPLHDRDQPAATIQVVGIQTQVLIPVGPGQLTLAQQQRRLREAAAFAMLHAAGLDVSAPPWVVEGLACEAVCEGFPGEEERASELFAQPSLPFGGAQWRYGRATADQLAMPPDRHQEAADRMAFLLRGDDAEHALALFAVLRETTAAAKQRAAAGGAFATMGGQPVGTPRETAFDQLLDALGASYASWKTDRLRGQPIFEPPADLPAEVVTAQREMLVLLKLARKLTPQAAEGPITRIIDRGIVRTKIITYASSSTDGKGAAGPASVPLSMAEFVTRLTDPRQPPWATLNVDGSLLMAGDTPRLAELLGPAGRYAWQVQGQRTVLVRQLDDGRILRGWLEDNPQHPRRPLARFQLATDRRRSDAPAEPGEAAQAMRLTR
jgi:hypothetical protein